MHIKQQHLLVILNSILAASACERVTFRFSTLVDFNKGHRDCGAACELAARLFWENVQDTLKSVDSRDVCQAEGGVCVRFDEQPLPYFERLLQHRAGDTCYCRANLLYLRWQSADMDTAICTNHAEAGARLLINYGKGSQQFGAHWHFEKSLPPWKIGLHCKNQHHACQCGLDRTFNETSTC